MSQANVEVMRGMYEAWLRGDPALFEAFDPEIELHPDPEAFWGDVNRTYRGHEGEERENDETSHVSTPGFPWGQLQDLV